MDYQEAIDTLKDEIKCSCYRNRGYCGICTIYSEIDRDKIIDACKCAISAMQELQEYHKYGMTPAEVARMQYGYAVKMTDLEDYQRIGTLEEVREAVENQRAKLITEEGRGE